MTLSPTVTFGRTLSVLGSPRQDKRLAAASNLRATFRLPATDVEDSDAMISLGRGFRRAFQHQAFGNRDNALKFLAYVKTETAAWPRPSPYPGHFGRYGGGPSFYWVIYLTSVGLKLYRHVNAGCGAFMCTANKAKQMPLLLFLRHNQVPPT